ncbi:hypothetical protein PybrP1_009128 [[Pythium] brassicae (nom. inval.)]|nr:hypothetical protein PybrP1_009128 [[Pythium] brassicae (nom. inval.)]
MDGYLLVFTKERTAQIRYCVLDCGLIRCYERPDGGGGGAVDCIELTRHRLRVKPLVGGNVSPNRFVVHTSEVKRKDQAGRLAAVALRETSHVFAAPSPDAMCRWVNAIHNWRRHMFDDPLTRFSAEDQSHRRAELEADRQGVVELAVRFDIRLASCRPLAGAVAPDPAQPPTAASTAAGAATAAKKKKKTKFPKIRPISAISEAAARKVLLMRPSRASGFIASLLPGLPTAKRESATAN